MKTNIEIDRAYFFDDGLRFECQQCGACCKGDPGVVYATKDEMLAIADVLNTSIDNLLAQGTIERYKQGYRFFEHAVDGRCVFFVDGLGCTVYLARPSQCRTWPFWLDSLRSQYNWKIAAKTCPGIGQGRLFSKDEILDIIKSS